MQYLLRVENEEELHRDLEHKQSASKTVLTPHPKRPEFWFDLQQEKRNKKLAYNEKKHFHKHKSLSHTF